MSDNDRSFESILLDLVRCDQCLPDTALLVWSRRLHWNPEIEEAARARAEAHKGVGLGDCYIAELLARGFDMSTIATEILGYFRPYMALTAEETLTLFYCHARGSVRKLAGLMACDRATVRRFLKKAYEG